MKTFIGLLLFTLLFISGLPATSFAKGKKRSPSASPRPSASPVNTSDRITALSLTSVAVTVYATHQAKEYKVTPATKIVVNGRPDTLSDLAVGMDIVVTTLPNDPTTAAAIDAKSPRR